MTKKTPQNNIDNSFGPNFFNRDDNGLLKNIQYIFDEDGGVNWRKMVQDEHLFPNAKYFIENQNLCEMLNSGYVIVPYI